MQTAERIYANTFPQHKTKLLNGLKILSNFLKFRSTNANCWKDLREHISTAQNETGIVGFMPHLKKIPLLSVGRLCGTGGIYFLRGTNYWLGLLALFSTRVNVVLDNKIILWDKYNCVSKTLQKFFLEAPFFSKLKLILRGLSVLTLNKTCQRTVVK